MLTDNDVARLDVAVQHAPSVRIFDCVANIDETTQQRAQFQRAPAVVLLQRRIGVEPVDGLFHAVAADEAHRVERPAIAVSAQAVDRHDAGMLEAAGDFGLQHEPLTTHGIVGVLVENLFQRHFPVQFFIQRDEDGAQAAARVGRRMRKRWPSLVAAPTE